MTAQPRHRMAGLAAVAVAFALVAVACGSDESATTTTTTTTTSAATTSAAPTTTTVAATATDTPSTTAVPPTSTAPTTTIASDTNSLAAGSGCTPGTADSLPDGEWFGYVGGTTASTLEFDLACWFSGDAAAQAAAEDGEESPPPNDYYVRNASPLLRTLDVASNSAVSWLPNPGDPTTESAITYEEWLAGRSTRDFQPGVWLTVTAGDITEVREQYVP